jgi:hypothetical protein
MIRTLLGPMASRGMSRVEPIGLGTLRPNNGKRSTNGYSGQQVALE